MQNKKLTTTVVVTAFLFSVFCGTFIFASSTGTLSGISAAAAAAWGSITGNLTNQADLQSELDLKAPKDSPTFTTATTHSYLTASQAVVTDGSKNLASLQYTNANTASTLVQRDGSGNFSAGTITAALTGNASTATALAANPTDCSAGQFATAIAANGNLTCGTGLGSGGSSTDNAIVRWDGTSGGLVQDSAVTMADTTGTMSWSGTGSLGTSASTGPVDIWGRGAGKYYLGGDASWITSDTNSNAIYYNAGNSTGHGGGTRYHQFQIDGTTKWYFANNYTDIEIGIVSGSHISMYPFTKALTADPTTITLSSMAAATSGGRYKMSSNDATATNRTVKLGDGAQDGQIICLYSTQLAASGAWELPAEANQTVLSGGTFTSAKPGDNICLWWEATDTIWYETSRMMMP